MLDPYEQNRIDRRAAAALQPSTPRQRLSRAPKMERIYQAFAGGMDFAAIARRERMSVAKLGYWLLEDFDFRDRIRHALRNASRPPMTP